MIGNCLSILPPKSNQDFLQLQKQNIWFVYFEYLHENYQIIDKLILLKIRMVFVGFHLVFLKTKEYISFIISCIHYAIPMTKKLMWHALFTGFNEFCNSYQRNNMCVKANLCQSAPRQEGTFARAQVNFDGKIVKKNSKDRKNNFQSILCHLTKDNLFNV